MLFSAVRRGRARRDAARQTTTSDDAHNAAGSAREPRDSSSRGHQRESIEQFVERRGRSDNPRRARGPWALALQSVADTGRARGAAADGPITRAPSSVSAMSFASESARSGAPPRASPRASAATFASSSATPDMARSSLRGGEESCDKSKPIGDGRVATCPSQGGGGSGAGEESGDTSQPTR